MRVIEPRRSQKPKLHSKKLYRRTIVCSFIIVTICTGLLTWNHVSKTSLSGVLSQDAQKDMRVNAPDQEAYRYFAAPEFQDLYANFAYPNTQKIIQPPSITGNAQADVRIRTIASSRGYASRSVPVSAIVMSSTPNVLLQEKAERAWEGLRVGAQSDKVPLVLVEGYRSIEEQREDFQARLKAAKLSSAQIINGQVNEQIVAILKSVAIPGYSKHQTGYTIDLGCEGYASFKNSPCYEWVSRDNYHNAKKSGWIPGFPEGLSDNSPEPEPQEFEWVGKQVLLQD